MDKSAGRQLHSNPVVWQFFAGLIGSPNFAKLAASGWLPSLNLGMPGCLRLVLIGLVSMRMTSMDVRHRFAIPDLRFPIYECEQGCQSMTALKAE